jgi:tubulin-specific chaperone A
MATLETPTLKNLRIKTGVLIRTHKELQHYHLELQTQKDKVAKMREDGRDVYDIKKQVEVQEETEVMIPDTMRRLAKAVDDLQGAVAMSESECAGSEQLIAAKKALQELGGQEGLTGGGGGGGGGGEQDDAI